MKNKIKTKKALAKRVKVKKTGSVSVGRAYTSHLSLNKTQKQKRKLRKGQVMSPSDKKRLRSLISGC